LKQTFYSNGKLLITGEYTVLDGATALALPTSYGQYLNVAEGDSGTIKWISKDADGSIWFEALIPFNAVVNKELSGQNEYDTLVNILHEAHQVNPDILDRENGYEVVTELTFPRHWGLGTSSTLINNIAQWFSIDAFELLDMSFGGSGYDIACAQNDTAIFYKLEGNKPLVEQVKFNPPFTNNLYFVYLNQKQNSRSAIAAYKEQRNNIAETADTITALTHTIAQAKTLPTFTIAVRQHETIMASILAQPTVQDRLFEDFCGTVKSLGAWGGDFVLAIAEDDPTAYFKNKGYNTILTYSQMILK
jgi:mevalonate kinase